MAPEAAYKVKTVSFLGRRVPIMLQDVNGPCPLLAIANVLLLRNQLQLPAGVGEVTQDRLVQMVAEYLLDSNSRHLEGAGGQGAALGTAGGGGQAGGGGLSDEQRASLAHNLSEVIGLLPKLTTGIDVNLRFHDIAGFEYTPETAVFDLLDIPLVHGWLVDPQDEPTARAVGSKTYNELVVQLVTSLGSAATPKQLTPTASLRSQQFTAEGGMSLTPRASGTCGPAGTNGLPAINEQGGAAGGPAVAAAAAAAASRTQQPAGQRQGQYIDADTLSAALRDSLRLSLPEQQQQQQPAEADAEAGSAPASAKSSVTAASVGLTAAGQGLGEQSRAASNISSVQTSDSMQSMVNRMLTDLVSDAFTSGTGTPYASRSTGQALRDGGTPTFGAGRAGAGTGDEEEGGEEATSALQPGLGSGSGSCSDLVAAGPAVAAGAGADAEEAATGAPSAGVDALAGMASSPMASGSLGWRAELSLEVDEEAAAAGQDAVRMQLLLRQPHPPPSPFDLSPSPSGSTSQQQLAGAGSGASTGAAARRSTPATPHPSSASMGLDQQEGLAPVPEAAVSGGAGAGAAGSEEAAVRVEPCSSGDGPREAAAGAGAAAAVAGSGASSPPGEAAVRDALLVQQFLEGSPSQLTVHGLVALHEGLRLNQLAVFFRNNHFNTMFKGPDGQLFILVTDEGFQYESDVVWEHLMSVDGDTALVGGDFRPFQPHASQDDAAARQAAAREEDWAAAAAAATAAGGDTHDADLALAMQLQAEEEERVRLEQERRRQQLVRQQQQQEQQQRAQAQAQAAAQQQAHLLPSQRRQSGSGSGGSTGRRKKEKKGSSDSSCSIM